MEARHQRKASDMARWERQWEKMDVTVATEFECGEALCDDSQARNKDAWEKCFLPSQLVEQKTLELAKDDEAGRVMQERWAKNAQPLLDGGDGKLFSVCRLSRRQRKDEMHGAGQEGTMPGKMDTQR